MGAMGFLHNSRPQSYDPCSCKKQASKDTTPNPNPAVYQIRKKYQAKFGGPVLVHINYPHCTNFEGNKLLIFRNNRVFDEMRNKNFIDPHFNDDSLIARFNPLMWDMAVKYVDSIS